MAQYIDKDALVAEIENLLKPVKQRLERDKNDPWDSDIAVYKFGKQLTKNLDTLEVKEVDLEKEIKEEYLKHRCYGGRDNMLVILNESQFNIISKHFFELGLKAQKGEKV